MNHNLVKIANKNQKVFGYFLQSTIVRNIKAHYPLYILSLPAFLTYVIFHYFPMYGLQIAFKDFNAASGIFGSKWVGLEHFQRFFNSYQFWTLIRNTLSISLYSLLVGFPIPILLALMLNEVRHQKFKKTVQMVTYAPHFISTVVMVGMLLIYLESPSGLVNKIIMAFGGAPIDFMAEARLFADIYVWSGIWQGAGWSSILYISALSGIDPQLHEAAIVDGASKIRRIWEIDIPGIMPVIAIQFILSCGGLMSVGFEKAYLMQNQLNLIRSEVISTYVYKVGIAGAEFSFSAAVGFFNSIINFIVLAIVNLTVRRMGDVSLW